MKEREGNMNIKEHREKAQMTQIELCKALGMRSTGTVSQWETGKRKPNCDMLIKLADLFHCTVDELLRSD